MRVARIDTTRYRTKRITNQHFIAKGQLEMDATTLQKIHRTLINFTKRAEKTPEDILQQTFVDSGPLFTLLSTKNNQIIYGRRGTGKTHALKVLARHIEQRENAISIFLDMRTVGSNGSIYSDQSRSLSERASALLQDVLSTLFNELYIVAVNNVATHPNPNEVTDRLDNLQNSITTVKIGEEISEEDTYASAAQIANSKKASLNVADKLTGGIELDKTTSHETSHKHQVTRNGKEKIYLSFGTISGCLRDMLYILGGKNIWILVDEWSEVPIDLQPYLGDLFRRVFLPIDEVVVKIAAIEHRSDFAIFKDRGEYIGLELGADLSADLNLDDFLVFDNSQEKSVDFIGNLIYRHYKSSAPDEELLLQDPNHFILSLFTQRPVFEEFVRAVEGVPRDALNLIAKVVTKAYGQQIAMNHVRSGALDWYNQDKVSIIRNEAMLADLLQHIIDEVIGNRRARAFLLPATLRHSGVDRLFDQRLLHILKKNVSSRDQPGVRFDVYKIDYGCYVDLINTSRAPMGLLEEDDGSYIEVPKDDYRSIRRAIFDPTKLTQLRVC
jgi:hypothetical protein